jgi:hypothetical protein
LRNVAVQRFLLISLLLLILTPAVYSQPGKTSPAGRVSAEVAAAKNSLLLELKALEADAIKLQQSLAMASAKVEIADAAWTLDQPWAAKLLREAYALTLPEEESQENLRSKPAGSIPTPPTARERAQSDVRNRVLRVAARDKALADELARLGAERLGKYEEHFRYASLASAALEAGDTEAAGKYILQSLEADPTQITAGFAILRLAARDRAAADKLIIQYIERLRDVSLSMTNQSAFRTYYSLQQIVFPGPASIREHGQIKPAGAAAVRAYVFYLLESMGQLKQSEPESLMMLRPFLLSTWLPLNQYAPELTASFMELERLSRSPGESSALPQAGGSGEESRRSRNEEQVKQALKNGNPDGLIIQFAISRGDFADARKLIALLTDEDEKTRFTEMLNTSEAIALAQKGETAEAEKLARQLNAPASILQAYPVIIGKCVAKKDRWCATSLLNQATKQLKRAENQSSVPLSLTRLAKSIAPINETLALETLDEAITVTNAGSPDTEQGQTGLDTSLFGMLAAKNEVRIRQSASALKDRLQRIAALAEIYKWQAKELSKALPANTQTQKSLSVAQ